MVNKRVRNAVLGCNLKNNRMISVPFQDKPFNITLIQVYAPISNAEEAKVDCFLWRSARCSRNNTPKRCPFHYRRLECKTRKSRDTWSNRQILPWSTKWKRSKANRVLPRECTGHSKHHLPATWEKTLHMDITTWLILKTDWLYSLQPKMENLYTFSKNKTRNWLWLRSWTPYCQIQTYIEESGEMATRPFRYDLNQIPYDYTVEVRNRFKGQDLIECLVKYGWRFVTLYRRQG